jgi:hypothetical protein
MSDKLCPVCGSLVREASDTVPESPLERAETGLMDTWFVSYEDRAGRGFIGRTDVEGKAAEWAESILQSERAVEVTYWRATRDGEGWRSVGSLYHRRAIRVPGPIVAAPN